MKNICKRRFGLPLKNFFIPLLLGMFPSVLFGQANQDSLCWLLRTAAYDGDSASVAFFLNTSEVNVDCSAYEETTALGYAVQGGFSGIAELLLTYGANPSGMAGQPYPPLSLAARHNQFDIAELLILYGASPDQSDAFGVFPLIEAIRQGNFLMADMLLHYGATASKPLWEGSTALHIASIYGHDDIAARLVETGADVNGSDQEGFTPLMIAAQYNDTLLAGMLIRAGANILARNEPHWNALALAIHASASDMVRMLAVFEPDTSRSRILNLATAHHKRDMIQILKEQGFKTTYRPLIAGSHISAGLSLFSNDVMFHYSFGLNEVRYNTRFSLGFEHRTKSATVLYQPPPPDLYQYQLWGSRTNLFLSAEKRFRIKQFSSGGIEIAASVRPGYTWGKFRGSEKRPYKGFIIGTKAGVYLEQYWGSTGLHYLYLPFKDYPVPPHRIGLDFTININSNTYKIYNKDVPAILSF